MRIILFCPTAHSVANPIYETLKYLDEEDIIMDYSDNKLLDKKQIRRMAYKESIKMMPIIIAGGLAVFPKGVAAVFGKPFKKRAKKANKEE
mgnify:CR=1 FL=1